MFRNYSCATGWGKYPIIHVPALDSQAAILAEICHISSNNCKFLVYTSPPITVPSVSAMITRNINIFNYESKQNKTFSAWSKIVIYCWTDKTNKTTLYKNMLLFQIWHSTQVLHLILGIKHNSQYFRLSLKFWKNLFTFLKCLLEKNL